MQGTGGGAAILAGSVACQRHLGPANAYFGEAGTFGLGIVVQALVELARDCDRRADTSPAFDHLPFADLACRRQCLLLLDPADSSRRSAAAPLSVTPAELTFNGCTVKPCAIERFLAILSHSVGGAARHALLEV